MNRLPLCLLTKRYVPVLVFAAYLLFGAVLTWPLIFNLDSTLFGGLGDAAGGVWSAWATAAGYVSPLKTELISAPFGFPAVRTFTQPIFEYLLVCPGGIFGEVRNYNLLALFSYIFTALSTYLVLDRLLKNKAASFIGGLIFGFCPAAIAHGAGGHITFSLNLFIPLLLLALLHNRIKRTCFSAALVGGAFAMVTLTCLYTGYFCMFVVIFFAAFDWIASKKQLGWEPLSQGTELPGRAFLLNYFWCAFFAALFILPFEYKAILEMFTRTKIELVQTGHVRSLGALVVYSVRMWEYFIPSIDHPVLGRFFEVFIRSHLHGSNTVEQTLYLGVAPLGLFITGIVLLFKKRFSQEHRFYFLLFAWGAAFMCLMSFPPYIPVGNYFIPLIGYFAHKVAPMFRVYSRFGMLVNLFVACGAAVVLAHLSGTLSKLRYRILVAIALIVLCFEYWSIPPNYAMPVKDPPAVYTWLAAQPGDFIVAEYPMMPNDEGAFSTYLFWQRVHGKRLVNGAGPAQKEAWAFFNKVNYPSDRQTLDLLRKTGIKYLVVHPEMYKEGPIPAYIKRHFPPDIAGIRYNNGVPPPIQRFIKPYQTFGADVVYKL